MTQLISRPYPHEHAARFNDPAKYEKLRRENDSFGDGIHVVWGIKRDDTTEIQAIRFDSKKYTPSQAKKWLKENKHKPESFEPAKDSEERSVWEERGVGAMLRSIANFISGNQEQEAEPLEDDKERALALRNVFDAVNQAIGMRGGYLVDFFTDTGGEMYAIYSRDGGLYRCDVMVNGDQVLVGESVRVMFEFQEVPRMMVSRQADGRYRWVSIACTAILNRDNEIDSTKLFDNFVAHINRGEASFPQLDFFHVDGTDMGEATFVARDGYVLVCSGLFDDDEVGRAAAEGLMNQPGDWAVSIMYKPFAGDILESNGVRIPVYTDGILQKVSIVPTQLASALFTTIEATRTTKGKKEMDQKIIDALAKLMQNRADLVSQVVEQADAVNARVTQGVATGTVVARTEAPVTAQPAQQAKSEAELLAERLKKIEDSVEALAETVLQFGTQTNERLAQAEKSEAARKQAWLAALPQQPAQETFRPREAAQAGTASFTFAQQAEESLRARSRQR